MMPSEINRLVFEDPKTDVFQLFPPPLRLPVAHTTMDEDQEYKPGTPAEMRQYNGNGSRLEEES